VDTTNTDASLCAKDRADRYSLAEQELFSLIAVTARFKRELAHRLNGQLTPGYLPVLGLILRTGRITQSEICEKLLVDKATLSRMVSKLEQLDFVKSMPKIEGPLICSPPITPRIGGIADLNSGDASFAHA